MALICSTCAHAWVCRHTSLLKDTIEEVEKVVEKANENTDKPLVSVVVKCKYCSNSNVRQK